MNKFKQPRTLLQTTIATAAVAVMLGGLTSTLYSDESKSDAVLPKADSAQPPTNSVALKASQPDTKKVPVKRMLTGAELYSMNCNRCHQERYPTERTGAQWKTIMLHMQVRANIPVSQAKLILQYLQDNSGR